MGEHTAISWTRHTFSPWWGCAEVSPACDHCYARAWAKRTGFADLWGTDAKRRFFSDAHWNEPLRWDRKAAAAGERRRVFCASMADVFDNHVDVAGERLRLWALIRATPNLDWLLLTKRIGNAKAMLPADWRDGFANAWLGATIANQQEAERDIPKLLGTAARIRFLSCEPLLGPIDLRRLVVGDRVWLDALTGCHSSRSGPGTIDDVLRDLPPLPGMLQPINWVIAGGESGPLARPSHPAWFKSLRDQCVATFTPFHFKQWGEWAPGENNDGLPTRTERTATWWNNDWQFETLTPRESEELHTDDEPDVYRLGVRHTGRMLDGLIWDEFPRSAE